MSNQTSLYRYYTIPSLESLVDYLADDGSCIVPNLCIGRRGYGSVYFDSEIDVAGLNLDELGKFVYTSATLIQFFTYVS